MHATVVLLGFLVGTTPAITPSSIAGIHLGATRAQARAMYVALNAPESN